MNPFLLLAATILAQAPGEGGAGPPRPGPLDVVEALETAVGDAVERARPSVVAINRIKSEDGKTRAIRQPGSELGNLRVRSGPSGIAGLGTLDPLASNYVAFDYASGVVIGDRGQILTTHHAVVGAARLIVRAPGVDPLEAVILAADPRSDLAVVAPLDPQVNEDGTAALKPLAIGDVGKLRIGSFLVALGNPFNLARDGEASASWGILANRARSLIPPPSEIPSRPSATQLQHFGTLLQLDAKLNLGMSGGAVVNMRGELMALTTASANALGYDPRAGYAIPMDAIGKRALGALMEGKEVEYGFIGVKLETLGERGSSNIVSMVEAGTPAGEGGIVVRDRIIEVNGQPVRDFESLTLAVNGSPVGRPVKVKILREGTELEKTVFLSKFPVEGEVIATNRPEPWRGMQVDFSSVVAMNQELTLEAMARGAVGIGSVQAGSSAELAGLEPGMVVVAVEGKKVRSPEEFRKLVDEMGPGPVKMTVVTPVGIAEAKTVEVGPAGAQDQDD
jgi:S1-C subfamily serine protease